MITVVTSSDSRAWVHSAWIVYIAEPSASSASTGRSGQATAAPVASGRPTPIAPPVSCSQSCGAQPAVAAVMWTLFVFDSSHTIAPSGIVAATAAASVAPVSAPVGRDGAGASSTGASSPTADASAASAPAASSRPVASTCTSHPSGTRSLGLPG